MFFKKARTHSCGHSNIDYRSMKDEENIKKFHPWKVKKDFGTMGYSDYHLKFQEYKDLMQPTTKFNTTYDKKNEVPNPKYYSSAVLYTSEKIATKPPAFFQSDKVAELDESFRGKDKYTGDSMMIAQITKTRKRSNWIENLDKVRKASKIGHLAHEKKEKNRDVDQETQIVKIDKTKDTAEHKIDVEKVNEIRAALRRRYANRTNFRKIFKDWDKGDKGVISLWDAKDMINKFGIPINFNETRALFLSSSTRNTETLNLEEFMVLIFSENEALKIDANKFKYKDESLYEGEKIDAFNKDLQLNAGISSKKLETDFLHNYLRIRIPVLVKAFHSQVGANKNSCDYDTFKEVIKSLNIHNKYTNDDLLTFLFNKHKLKEGEMNFKGFIEELHVNKLDNDFYEFKDKVFNQMKSKIDDHKQLLIDNIETLKKNPNLQKYAEIDHDIIEDKEGKKRNDEKENIFSNNINSTQPSEGFFRKMWKDNKLYEERIKDTIHKMSPDPVLIKNEGKTRFSANPPFQNTMINFQAVPNSGLYISEKNRFNVRRKSEVDFQAKEKSDKILTNKVKIEKLKHFDLDVKTKNFMTDLIIEEKRNYSLLQRSKNMLKYETICKNRNNLIE